MLCVRVHFAELVLQNLGENIQRARGSLVYVVHVPGCNQYSQLGSGKCGTYHLVDANAHQLSFEYGCHCTTARQSTA